MGRAVGIPATRLHERRGRPCGPLRGPGHTNTSRHRRSMRPSMPGRGTRAAPGRWTTTATCSPTLTTARGLPWTRSSPELRTPRGLPSFADPDAQVCEGRRTSRPVRRVLSPGASRHPDGRSSISACRCRQAPAVHPQASGGQPSNACAGRRRTAVPLDLAPGGVYRAAPVTRCAGGLLHHRFTLTSGEPLAVCSLWHCPAGHPGSPLATTLPCGARTFLGDGVSPADATARPTRPSWARV